MAGCELLVCAFLVLHLSFRVLPVTALEPFSAGLAMSGGMLASAVWSSRNLVYCTFRECCEEPWIDRNVSQLEEGFSNVFGQHLVHSLVTKSVRAHMRKADPSKALVLSFHGWTGAGKNYVSKFVAESMFKEGMKSKFVHQFIAPLHFPHLSEVDIYKLRLQDWIRGNVSQCAHSLFIIDEIDKMPPGVINGIKPFIDHHEAVDGVNFRKAVFIFLSNTGGKEITMKALSQWEAGRAREEITYQDLEEILNMVAFNEQGGLHKSSIVEKSLVDAYVPFLPMERRHVLRCIQREAEARNRTITPELEQAVADSLAYWPPDTKIFSTSGCKRVANKLDLLLEDDSEP